MGVFLIVLVDMLLGSFGFKDLGIVFWFDLGFFGGWVILVIVSSVCVVFFCVY